ncbi:hypothetical protein TYRP_013668 [Tyrophagus putrescentiae]|nr:hypothetical protein TYRP_013668 [Tyrophagus putrescentiae]
MPNESLTGSGKCTNRFGTFKSFMTATRSPEGQSINTKLSYMKFLTICIEYIFHEHPSHPKIKIRKSSKIVRGVPP